MAKRQFIDLLVSSYNKTSGRSAVPQSLKNMFLEEMPIIGGTRFSAYSCPGIEEWVDLSTSYYTRGGFVHNDTLYCVSGTTVFSVDTAGTKTNLGTIDAPVTTDEGRVSIAATNDDVVFCDGFKAWNYRISTGTFSQITDIDFPYENIKRVVAAGEYILFIIGDSQTVFVSDVSDATSVNALSFFTAQSFFDNISSGIVAQNYVYLFGSSTTDIFYNDGGNTVPFDSVIPVGLSYGIAAKNALAVVNNEVYFLAKDSNGLIGLMKYAGTTPSIIMNRSLNEKLKDYESIENCFFWVTVHNGHQLLCMTFPTKTAIRSATHYYDVTTGKWGELETWNPLALVTAGYEGHPAQWCVYFNNKQYIGSRFNSSIYEISMDIYDDAGYEMVRELITPYIFINDEYFSVSSLELDFERSIASATGQGADPVVSLWVTNDRCGTFQGAFQRSVGQIGDYNHRTLYQSLGGGRSMAFKISMSDPVPWVLHAITLEATVSG